MISEDRSIRVFELVKGGKSVAAQEPVTRERQLEEALNAVLGRMDPRTWLSREDWLEQCAIAEATGEFIEVTIDPRAVRFALDLIAPTEEDR
jgi:hypothetical protein